MNFTTDLPKKDPIVSYIVASAVQCEKFFPDAAKLGPVFRMHAVTLTDKYMTSKYSKGVGKTSYPVKGMNISQQNRKGEGFANYQHITDSSKITQSN